jgi:GT2 family glycosyltransferase
VASAAHVVVVGTQAVLVLVGAVIGIFGMASVAIAVAALSRRHERTGTAAGAPSLRIAVVVPAHDEALFIGRCVQSLRAQTYPEALYEVIVIADNCSDATADIAASEGARVLERNEPLLRGKGHALRWAAERVLAMDPAFNAIAVVDADSVAEPDFLAILAAPLVAGAEAAQGESLLFEDGSPRTALRAAAFLLINRARPAGRRALGLPCGLVGNGMLLSRSLLEAHPWQAFSSTEDLEYSLSLRAAGVRPVFAPGAVLLSPVASSGSGAEQQRLRWTGGKVSLAREWLPRLVRRSLMERRPDLLDTAFELAMPPLGLFAGFTLLGASASAVGTGTGAFPYWTTLPWAVAMVSLPAYVLIGLVAARAPASAYRALTVAPLFVGSTLLRSRELVRFRADTWQRARRPNEQI